MAGPAWPAGHRWSAVHHKDPPGTQLCGSMGGSQSCMLWTSQQNLPQIKTHGYSKSERDRSYSFHQYDHRFCLGKCNSSLVCLFSVKIPLKSCGQKVCGEGMLSYRQAFGQERAHVEGMCRPSFILDCAALAANHFKGVSLYWKSMGWWLPQLIFLTLA